MTDDTTIPMDVEDDEDVKAFLSSFADDPNKRLSENTDEAPDDQDETPEPSENDQEGEPEDGSEQTDENDPDNQEFEVKVGNETKKATLRELKRLYGQEQSLTQKSQKASEQLRESEARITRATEATKVLLERAQARYKPYAELDWLTLARPDVMDKDAFQQLRADADEAERDVKFLTQELDGHMKNVQTQAAAAYRAAADECVRVLSDPKTGIEGFGEPLYNELVAFGRENGLEGIHAATNPAVYKLLNMAMQYAKAQKAAKEAEAKAQRVKDAPARVLKPGKGSRPADKKAQALQRLRQTHDEDDAVAAFMASF